MNETMVNTGGHKYATHFHKIETYIHTSLYLLGGGVVDDAELSEGDCDGVSTDAIIWGDCNIIVPTMTEGNDATIVGLFVIGEGVSTFSSSSDVVGKSRPC